MGKKRVEGSGIVGPGIVLRPIWQDKDAERGKGGGGKWGPSITVSVLHPARV